MMGKNKVIYKSYLLRLGRDEENGRWIVRLETIDKEAQVLFFTDLESLVAFLGKQL